MTNIYAALEIGSTSTVLAVGEAETGGRLKISCKAKIPSTGVKKSQIINMNAATQSIKSVVMAVEKQQAEAGDSLTIGNAFLVVSGRHVNADMYQATVQVEGAKVGDDDIDDVVEASRLFHLPKDRELLDISDLCFSLDGLSGIRNPKGMSGRILKLDTLQIHADRNRIDDARTAAEGAHLELRDPLFAAACAADAVLSESDRRSGALVIDLGGGSTGYAVYSDGMLTAANAFGVGGDHVTNDIAYAFQTTQAHAESLKLTSASAVLQGDYDAVPRTNLPGITPIVQARTISRRALDTVVNLRMKEILSIVRSELEGYDMLHRLHAGAVLVGGGAYMRGICELVQRELGIPAKIGAPL